MCIRDSLHVPDRLIELGSVIAGGVAGKFGNPEEGIGHHGACLLYTSDAADERSSVDLGGRRIIKKKKNEEINRSEYIQQM